MEYYASMSEAINKLKEKGYDEDFMYEDGRLKCTSCAKSYTQDQLKIVNIFRFEGDSNPDDMAILYVLEATDGTRGTIVDAFGIYQNADLANFMKYLEDRHKTNIGMGEQRR